MSIVLAYILATAFLVVAVRQVLSRRRRTPMSVLALLLGVFIFGPLLVYALGGDIFRSLIEETLPQAVVIELLLLVPLLVAAYFLPPVKELKGDTLETRTFWILDLAYPIVGAYFLLQALLTNPFTAKKASIASIGAIHYPSLTLGTLLVATAFLASRQQRKRYWLFVAAFSMYNVVTWERDFLIALGGVLAYYWLLGKVDQPGRRRWISSSRATPILIIVVGGYLLAAILFQLRKVVQGARPGQGALDLLNQSAVLSLDSWVLASYNQVAGMLGGASYLDSIRAVVPGLEPAGVSLSIWFKQQINPTGDVGYGFSLALESFLNFGYFGVILSGALIAFSLALTIRYFKSSYFARFMGPLLFASIFYNSRGESRGLLAVTVYGLVFFGVLVLGSRSAANRELDGDPDASPIQGRAVLGERSVGGSPPTLL